MLPRKDGPVSPRRRALLLIMAAVIVLAAVAVALVQRGGSTPTVGYARQDVAGPVLLVPGYGGSTSALEVLAGRLRDAGKDAVVVALPGDGTGDLREAARALATVADKAIAAGAPSVDVVGYSAGGVVVRDWVRELGGDRKARRVITLGSPHHGTKLAALGAAFVPGACPTACEQLVPGSSLLNKLNGGDETPAGPQWVSVWTTQDETVTPPESAHLDGAEDIVLQSVCPGLAVSHSDLPRIALVTRIVLDSVQTGPVLPPSKADC